LLPAPSDGWFALDSTSRSEEKAGWATLIPSSGLPALRGSAKAMESTFAIRQRDILLDAVLEAFSSGPYSDSNDLE